MSARTSRAFVGPNAADTNPPRDRNVLRRGQITSAPAVRDLAV
ncbi:hypothetical protein AAFP35_11195 [Gordonia sp. CPCC 206044]